MARTAALFVVAVVVLVGCAAPGYNPTRIQSELVRAGTTPEQARCVTNGLTHEFDLNQLGSHSAPSASTPPTTRGQTKPNESELQLARDILARCGVKLPLNPLPR